MPQKPLLSLILLLYLTRTSADIRDFFSHGYHPPHHHHYQHHLHRHPHHSHHHHGHHPHGLLHSGTKCDSDRHSDLKHYVSGHDVKFPCASTKNIYTASGRYEPANIIATRIQIGHDHAYIALPRLKHGVPFTLSRIKLRKSDGVTELEPYPCWSLQEEGNCDSLQSVVDLTLDAKVTE